jgi:nucleotide-binding universal stress UspA family protein
MFRRIIVGADGYSGGPDALCLAATLAADGAELVLADAYPERPPLNRAALDSYEAMLRDDARAVLGARRPGARVEVRVEAVADASPEVALRVLAQREGADLIVIGPGRHGSRHLALLRRATGCPVAVAPGGYSDLAAEPRALGVGFDASPEAMAALRLAVELAAALGARLHVRAVAEVRSPAAAQPGPFDCEQHERQARALLARATAALDVPAEGDVVAGSPGKALQALSQQVDILLTGAPGEAKSWRLLDGSPADWLLVHAGCPVIVVPQDALRRRPAPPVAGVPAVRA